jgi:hypothetical protein
MIPIVKHVVTKVGGNFPHPTKAEVQAFKLLLQRKESTKETWFVDVGAQFLKEHDYLTPSLLFQPLSETINSKKDPALAEQAKELAERLKGPNSIIPKLLEHGIVYQSIVSLVSNAHNLDQVPISDFWQKTIRGRTRRVLETVRVCYLREKEEDVLDLIRDQTFVK